MQKPASIPSRKSPIKNSRGIKGYFNDLAREMRKVTWPTTQETLRLTGIVFLVSFLVAAILILLGMVADTIIQYIVTGGKVA